MFQRKPKLRQCNGQVVESMGYRVACLDFESQPDCLVVLLPYVFNLPYFFLPQFPHL